MADDLLRGVPPSLPKKTRIANGILRRRAQWAAYEFSGYRENRTDAEIAKPPYIRMEDNFTWWALGATIGVDAATQWQLGLSAVLEERTAPSPIGRSRIPPMKSPISMRPFASPRAFRKAQT